MEVNTNISSSRIQQVLDEDKNLESYGLKVDMAGDIVTVTGIVDTLSEKEHVERLIKSAAGDKKLEMAVSISTDGAVNDKDVDMEVAEELTAQPELGEKVSARVEKGVVYLSGNVENEELKQKAVNTASKARGVTRVIDRIKVVGSERIDESDDIFHSQVRNDQEE